MHLVASTTTATSAAGGVPSTPEEAFGLVGLFVDAVGAKNWPLVVGLALAVAVWALKTYGVLDKVKLGSKWGVRFSTLFLSSLASVALGLQGGLPWTEVVMNAIQVAFAAVGGWEFVGKLVRDAKNKKPAPATEETASAS